MTSAFCSVTPNTGSCDAAGTTGAVRAAGVAGAAGAAGAATAGFCGGGAAGFAGDEACAPRMVGIAASDAASNSRFIGAYLAPV